MHRRSNPEILFLVLLLAVLAAVPAEGSWRVSPGASLSDFKDFHRRFSDDAYFYPRHGAAPLGLVGFEVYVDATYDGEFDGEPFNETAIEGGFSEGFLPGGFLSVARVGARKGLPGGIDLGLSYGTALNGDVDLVSAEIQYALLKGGLLSPALSVRVTGTRTVDAKAYSFDQYGAEVLFSKGFTVLTPYIGAGAYRTQGKLETTFGRDFEDTATRDVLYAGVTLNLLLPKITVEIEKGEVVQGAVRIGIGF